MQFPVAVCRVFHCVVLNAENCVCVRVCKGVCVYVCIYVGMY